MTAVYSGIDLVEIERLRKINPRIKDRFLQRVFTPQELAGCANASEHLAGKFAAKEAASKALGCGIGEVGWQDLEILSDAQHKPHLHLHGHAALLAEKAGWKEWTVSISHTRDYAVATVFALAEKSAADEK